jgi:uncharacterized damage-inducible protein DinB
VREAKEFQLRSLCSFQDGNENRGQLFTLTRVLPNSRPFGLPVYVALLPAGSILVAAGASFFALTTPELLARIRRMRPCLTFSISLIIAANLHTAIAQSSPTPAPTPVTLRSLLLSELHSTHDNAEWFTPIKAAVAGLTAEQAKWVPQNAQGKIDPSANHSVGMLAYHLVFWNENALARLRGEKPASPGNNQETFNDFDAAHLDEIVQRLDRVMKDLEAAVEKMPDEKLALKAPLISHISTHNAYHTGQILYVRKLQGSWNPENGVK